jgi:hypothetical protein
LIVFRVCFAWNSSRPTIPADLGRSPSEHLLLTDHTIEKAQIKPCATQFSQLN